MGCALGTPILICSESKDEWSWSSRGFVMVHDGTDKVMLRMRKRTRGCRACVAMRWTTSSNSGPPRFKRKVCRRETNPSAARAKEPPPQAPLMLSGTQSRVGERRRRIESHHGRNKVDSADTNQAAGMATLSKREGD